jgi:hypothetical protein
LFFGSIDDLFFMPCRPENSPAESSYSQHEPEIVPPAGIGKFIDPAIRKKAYDK